MEKFTINQLKDVDEIIEFRNLIFNNSTIYLLEKTLTFLIDYGYVRFCPFNEQNDTCRLCCGELFPESDLTECTCSSIDIEIKIERLKEFFKQQGKRGEHE